MEQWVCTKNENNFLLCHWFLSLLKCTLVMFSSWIFRDSLPIFLEGFKNPYFAIAISQRFRPLEILTFKDLQIRHSPYRNWKSSYFLIYVQHLLFSTIFCDSHKYWCESQPWFKISVCGHRGASWSEIFIWQKKSENVSKKSIIL